MSKGKTNKSFAKRLKVTKNGKVLARKPGHGHFNPKESRSKQLKKNKNQEFKLSNKDISRVLPNS